MTKKNNLYHNSFLTIVFSTFWFFVANSIGLVLSLLLVNPQLGLVLQPVTYGRLIPLHLNFHLYGWLSYPILGLLFYWFHASKKLANLAMIFWSVCLLTGGGSWLMGYSSGKIFLEWSDNSAIFLQITFLVLWLILAISYLPYVIQKKERLIIVLLKMPLLLILATLPFVFGYAMDPKVYPAINPDSGGPTGTSLLGSTLGLILVFGCLPGLLQGALAHYKAMLLFALLLVVHLVIFSFMDHGHITNLSIEQYLGLGSLILWIPIIFWYYRQFQWPAGSKLWILSFAIWGSLLTLSATFMFLPGQLEQVKFSSFLVAHSHVAMAGMLTATSMLILFILANQSSRDSILHSYLTYKFPFYLWNIGLTLHLLALVSMGYLENIELANSFRSDFASHSLDLLRMLAGILMTGCSGYWFISSINYAFKNKTNSNL